MIQHRCRPGEPGDELEPQTGFGRDADVIEGEHERSDGTSVHLLTRAVAGVDPDDVGIVADRARIARWPAELLRPLGREARGVLRVDTPAKA